jgi:transcriptional regulator of acetoin/glycerol metabolism
VRAQHWVLVALGGSDLRTYPLPAGSELILGRDLDCDVVLAHHRVSRRHARLRVASAADIFAIEDLGSRNGTRVGEPLKPHQPCPVRPGDPIGIGPFTLTAVRGPADVPPTLAVDDPSSSPPSSALVGVARGDAHVLVHGDPDGGPRTLAELIHRLSGRTGRYIALDCAAFPADALEGALLGGSGGPPGAIEEATDGTLFLDRIGAMPLALQVRLLQILESHELPSAGEAVPLALTTRLVCSVYRDLRPAIEIGAFRLDLYFRLAGATLALRHPRVVATPDEEAERQRILDALGQSGGSQSRAAKLLGISRTALVTKLTTYRIERTRR